MNVECYCGKPLPPRQKLYCSRYCQLHMHWLRRRKQPYFQYRRKKYMHDYYMAHRPEWIKRVGERRIARRLIAAQTITTPA